MSRSLKAFGFNFLFWSIFFVFLLALRFHSATTPSGAYVLPIEFPAWRVFGNGLLLGFLLSVPYTIMEGVLRKRDIYRGSLLRVIAVRSGIQLVLALFVFLIVGFANYAYDQWLGHLTEQEITIKTYLIGVMMRFFVLAALLGNIILSVYRTLQMKIGEEIFHDLLFGRFNPAKEEERAFLFLDLKSSTTIAERLGHQKYSFFIQDCFRDLHAAVVASGAEIYQYVGDEAVLTWERARAIENHNCLRAFFLYQEDLKQRSDYYRERYGEVPIFKAGLNLGKVMTAEVGVIKRDIAYHSDVLNTAARVQGLSNEKKAPFLVTEHVIEALPKPIPYNIIDKGEVSLRGRDEQVRIYEVLATGN